MNCESIVCVSIHLSRSSFERSATLADARHRGAAPAGRPVTAAVRTAPPTTFLGRPLAHWFFGLRTWAGMMLALAVAFWVQLDGASSALVTAAILALPTRGQALSKAFYRLVGTAVGVLASLVIAGLFNEVRSLFVVAVAAWHALCVFAANMLDGNRAYAAVLSGYTVAIVAVANIDSPQDTFSSGINRGAAIAIGIAAVAFVSDLVRAPDVLPGFLKRVKAAHGEVRAFALGALERGTAEPLEVARLLARVTALRADAMVLPGESVAGRARAAAARRAVSEMVREARAARILAATLAFAGEDGPSWRARVTEALDDREAADRLLARAARVVEAEGASLPRLIAARGVAAVVGRDRTVADAVRDLAAGRGPARGPRLKLYRSRRAAGRNALRTFLAILISSAFLVVSGLPAASASLLFVCILAGLSANSPDPRGFMVGALVAIPLAAVAAGVTEFLVLDGVDAFPLLALALLPTVLAAGLLMTAGKPALSGIGFLLLVFTPALMSLANPQSYNPSGYLNESLFIVTSAVLLAAAIVTLLPTDDARRRGWMLSSTRRELTEAVRGRRRGRLTLEEASFRAADRLGQLAGLAYRDAGQRDGTLAHALHLSEVTFSVHRVRDALGDRDDAPAREARAALGALDAPRLRAVAVALCEDERGRWAGANVARTAALIERHAADIALARAGRAP